MDHINAKFDKILNTKMKIVIDTISSKSEIKKMTKTNINEVDYTAKQTLSKITAEQDRKYKSSKAYKNTQEYKPIS